ncbi:MAG: CvpA family protein [Anaerolineae bacterium]|nr:CvpA family protein [Anaerolineae bacterium]
MISHTASSERQRVSPFPPVIIATLGTISLLVYGYMTPRFQLMEFGVLFVAILFCAVGYTQNVVRSLASGVALYLTAGLAVRFYVGAAPYIGSPFGEEITRNILTLSYVVLALAFWALLESLSRAFLRDASLPWLGFFDHLSAAVVYLILGLLVASILFTVLGYSSQLRGQHNASVLRPVFNEIFRPVYISQTPWFAQRSPAIYAYDIHN